MKKRILLVVAAMSVVFACNVYASPKPDKCPSISAIQSAGLSEVRKYTNSEGDTVWVGFQPRSMYDTNQEWTFVVSPFRDEQADVALKNAIASLPTLSLKVGPDDHDNSWLCLYLNPGYTIGAVAITPPRDFPLQLSRLIKE